MGTESNNGICAGRKFECNGIGVTVTVPAKLLCMVSCFTAFSGNYYKACLSCATVIVLYRDGIGLVCLQRSTVRFMIACISCYCISSGSILGSNLNRNVGIKTCRFYNVGAEEPRGRFSWLFLI